jgi:hypothetical protein
LCHVVTQVNGELHKLPPPPSDDAKLELFRRLRSLSDSVQDAVQGRGDVSFFRAADSHYGAFKHSVLAARPRVQLSGTATAASGMLTFGSSSTSGNDAAQDTTSSSIQLQEEAAEFWLGCVSKNPAAAGSEAPLAPSVEGADEQQQKGLPEIEDDVITLEAVRDLAHKYKTVELPEFFPFRVVQELVQSLKGRWDAAAQACLHDVAEELQELTARLVQQHFGQFSRAEMYIR